MAAPALASFRLRLWRQLRWRVVPSSRRPGSPSFPSFRQPSALLLALVFSLAPSCSYACVFILNVQSPSTFPHSSFELFLPPIGRNRWVASVAGRLRRLQPTAASVRHGESVPLTFPPVSWALPLDWPQPWFAPVHRRACERRSALLSHSRASGLCHRTTGGAMAPACIALLMHPHNAMTLFLTTYCSCHLSWVVLVLRSAMPRTLKSPGMRARDCARCANCPTRAALTLTSMLRCARALTQILCWSVY